MGVRIRGPRLNQRDIEDLLASHAKLVSLDRLLKQTNWAAAPACVILAGEVDLVIARLYNKAEAAMTRPPSSAGADLPGGHQAEIPPATAPELPRPPDPAVLLEEKIQKCVHGLSVDQSCGLCRLGESSN